MTDIFVFGSNLAGRHGKGAALHAAKKYGAVRGVGEGLTMYSYAIPTKDEHLQVLPISDIDASICRFLKYANDNPECRFLLTPIGTGLAGYKKSDIWSILKRESVPENVVLTSSWVS